MANKKILVFFILALQSLFSIGQIRTGFSQGGGEYTWMLEQLEHQLLSEKGIKIVHFGGKPRTEFVQWIRDHVHVMKAMKYLHPDMSSFLEFYLENQTAEGIYFDYYYPLNIRGISKRKQIFDHRYWKEIPEDSIEMHRLPVEADLEYLLVEGVYAVYQSGGDTDFVRKWMPAIEKGMHYSMSDSLRWSAEYGLVKRGYTLDTWDFMQLPLPRKEYTAQGGDIQKGIFNIDASTPMGIMHGDNSGIFAAAEQLSGLNSVLGNKNRSEYWKETAKGIRTRSNNLLWNGKYYKHFIEADPQPAYLNMDQANTLSLSNPYDINRGLPTEAMAESIIGTYQSLKQSNRDSSFAEWYGVYPPVRPHFADYLPGSYMNGGVNTIVAGELAKAAFQHGYEAYGVDILKRLDSLMRVHHGDLPVSYMPDGKVDEGIPDNWGQAAVYSAMIEGLAGVVDHGKLFDKTEISPRWLAAGIDSVTVNVIYRSGNKSVRYKYYHEPANKRIIISISGDLKECFLRILLPDKVQPGSVKLNGKKIKAAPEQVRESKYLSVNFKSAGENIVSVGYR